MFAALTPQGRAAKIGAAAIRNAAGKLVNGSLEAGRAAGRRLRELLDDQSSVARPAEKPFGERPNNVPKDWVKSSSRNEKGIRYRDPSNIHNEVRIQKGNPNSLYNNSRDAYVRWKKNGRWLDKDGIPSNDPEKTHIPIKDFKFDPKVFL